MAPTSKADKATLDAAAWMFNVVTSVGIIIVNKALMATYGFSFGKFCLVYLDFLLFIFLFPLVQSHLIFCTVLLTNLPYFFILGSPFYFLFFLLVSSEMVLFFLFL